MARFRVRRPIEHNEKLYVSEHTQLSGEIKSAGNGQVIPFDASGTIELSQPEAAPLLDGRAEPLEESSEPEETKKS